MKNDNPYLKRIYISLDCLLDLRLGTMNIISTDFALEVTTKENYFTREADVFSSESLGTLSKLVYDGVFSKYKHEIVRNSIKTRLYGHLGSLMRDLQIQSISSPQFSGIELCVNFYPYTFSLEEQDRILEAIRYNLNGQYQVVKDYITPESLTPSEVKRRYAMLIMYDYTEWLNIHHKAIINTNLKDTPLIIPRVQFTRALTEEEKQLLEEESNKDIFELLTVILKDLINIVVLPISLYCADTPLNLEEYTEARFK